ncbi:uncharacterized protein LOC116618156 [Nematostella vectensis]|uniref:uncharacterized protein LOC116618156 n=1 Tax=Nematostella vectensis TaxID=45351 RepID=UPI0020778A6E|nr:uncharacterized protein LOC116618156 [Nematostella vectensis]
MQLIQRASEPVSVSHLLGQPLSASTPRSTPTKVQSQEKTHAKVTLNVDYPSNKVKKVLSPDYESLGKAIIHGPPSRIANAVMKCAPVSQLVVEKVLRIFKAEVADLCSRKQPSFLRKRTKKDLEEFDFEKLCQEWRKRAPLFYSFLLTACTARKRENVTWFPSMALAGSILLKQRCSDMNTTACIMAVLVKTRSMEATLSRLNKLKVTCSNTKALQVLDVLGEDHDHVCVETQKKIAHEVKATKEAMENHTTAGHCTQKPDAKLITCKGCQEIVSAKTQSHPPGFVVAFDNIDMTIGRRQMTISAQNEDIHWVNHAMIMNRVSGNGLQSECPKATLTDIPNIEFLQTLMTRTDNDLIALYYIFRMNFFSIVLFLYSSKVPLGVIFKDENTNEDMLHILQQFHGYLPHLDEGQYDPQIFAGVQLSIERAVNLIAAVANGYTPESTLEGMHLQIGDWHTAVKVLSLLFKRFYSAQSDGDLCTMYADRTTINRRNVTADPSKAYHADRDFLIIVIQSRIIAAAMEVLGIKSKSDQPTKCAIPKDMENMSKLEKLTFLHKVSGLVVDAIVFDKTVNGFVDSILTAREKQDAIDNQVLTPDGRFPCRYHGCTRSFAVDGKCRRKHELTHDPPPNADEINTFKPSDEIPESAPAEDQCDDVYAYNCSLLSDGLLFMNFLDAIAEGDGLRIVRQFKYFLLHFKVDGIHSHKYALESLYQSFLFTALLSPRDAERFIWNRTVNNCGLVGRNIPLDLDVEHSNKFLKQAFKNLGPNLTEAAVTRICRAENSSRAILASLDSSIQRSSGSSEHTCRSTERDLETLVNSCITNKVFTPQDNRHYVYFRDFQRDPFASLDMSELYKWINKHKKNIECGLKAR